MAKKSKKNPSDVNLLAREVVQAAIGEPLIPPQGLVRQKNPAAVALGRLGASKGGKVRAKKLSARARKAIARKAARVRWAAESGRG